MRQSALEGMFRTELAASNRCLTGAAFCPTVDLPQEKSVNIKTAARVGHSLYVPLPVFAVASVPGLVKTCRKSSQSPAWRRGCRKVLTTVEVCRFLSQIVATCRMSTLD